MLMHGIITRKVVQRPPMMAAFQIAKRFASQKKQPKIELQHMGVSVDLYMHPSGKNLPSWFSSPMMRVRGIGRRLAQFFQNTVLIGQFRLKSKIKPRFVEWKNQAIETYVAANRAFAKDELDNIKPNLSLWVYEALKSRRENLPQGTKLDWKLVKFNSKPRVMAMQPMMMPDQPLTHLMIVYRFDTKQRLVKIAPGDSEATKVDRDVVDYVACVYDCSKKPADMCLSGTLFETPLSQPRPNPMAASQSEKLMLLSMKEKGDIYRSPPPIAV